MNITIDSDTQNEALKRREVKFTVMQDSATVSKADLLAELCKKLSERPENSIIVRIDQYFGEKRSSGTIHVYQSAEAMEKTEPKYVLKRSGKLPEEKKKPAAEKQEQAPEAKEGEKEQKKEEKKHEKKEEKAEEKEHKDAEKKGEPAVPEAKQ